jgi:hypothetical protein
VLGEVDTTGASALEAVGATSGGLVSQWSSSSSWRTVREGDARPMEEVVSLTEAVIRLSQ